jgi:hypothetical protein
MIRAPSFVVAVALAALGCTSSSPAPATDAGACGNDLPRACPTQVPSYKTDIAPLIMNRCLHCHAPGGQESSRDFTTYQGVYTYRSAILDQVYACSMPPADQPQPTAPERTLLLDWLVCHAPDN